MIRLIQSALFVMAMHVAVIAQHMGASIPRILPWQVVAIILVFCALYIDDHKHGKGAS